MVGTQDHASNELAGRVFDKTWCSARRGLIAPNFALGGPRELLRVHRRSHLRSTRLVEKDLEAFLALDLPARKSFPSVRA